MTFSATQVAAQQAPCAPMSYLAQRVAPLCSGRSVLDVGCWTGDLPWALSRLVECDYTGVDIEPAAPALAVAQRRAPGGRFRTVGSAERLPFADASFDVVIFSKVLEHLPAGAEHEAIEELERILRPGGTLVLATFLHNRLSALDPAWYFGHRHYPEDRVLGYLQGQGFDVRERWYTGGAGTALDMLLMYVYKHLLRKPYATPGALAPRVAWETRPHEPGAATIGWFVARKPGVLPHAATAQGGHDSVNEAH